MGAPLTGGVEMAVGGRWESRAPLLTRGAEVTRIGDSAFIPRHGAGARRWIASRVRRGVPTGADPAGWWRRVARGVA